MIYLFLISLISQAQILNHCKSYESSSRYMNAISVVAQNYSMTASELCFSNKFIGIEAQPNRIVTRDGEVIPHTTVHLHSYSSSCVFYVHDENQVVSKGRCYSGE